MNILVTGANGFIGKNLIIHLIKRRHTVFPFSRENSDKELQQSVDKADWIFHLAGVNRPQNPDEFSSVNVGLTSRLCDIVTNKKKQIPIVFVSSSQALKDNPYGKSKLEAEKLLKIFCENTGCAVKIFRLPGVFGKWCRPNYNSVVATFCYNIARGLPIKINDPNATLKLVYVDEVVNRFLNLFTESFSGYQFDDINPVYKTTVGKLAKNLELFESGRKKLNIEQVGEGYLRALYSTYISYLTEQEISYPLPVHYDQRGSFSEVLKTVNSGQFSFFTARSGVTRGGHYHHTKTEKFLVVKGKARFRFKNILTKENFSIATSSDIPQIVETIPGWAHDITNVGSDEMIVMLWSSEVFDPDNADTFSYTLTDE